MQIKITEKTVTFEAILRVVTQFFLSDATGVMVDVVDEHAGAISSVLITKQSANDKIYVEVFDLFAELDLRSEEIVDSIITMFKYSGYQIRFFCHCSRCGHDDIMTVSEMKNHKCEKL